MNSLTHEPLTRQEFFELDDLRRSEGAPVPVPPANGIFYNATTNEYEVYIDGECWYYNRLHGEACRVYGEALAQMSQHAERCPADRYGLEAVA